MKLKEKLVSLNQKIAAAEEALKALLRALTNVISSQGRRRRQISSSVDQLSAKLNEALTVFTNGDIETIDKLLTDIVSLTSDIWGLEEMVMVGASGLNLPALQSATNVALQETELWTATYIVEVNIIDVTLGQLETDIVNAGGTVPPTEPPVTTTRPPTFPPTKTTVQTTKPPTSPSTKPPTVQSTATSTAKPTTAAVTTTTTTVGKTTSTPPGKTTTVGMRRGLRISALIRQASYLLLYSVSSHSRPCRINHSRRQVQPLQSFQATGPAFTV